MRANGKTLDVAVVGATGVVGEAIVRVLAERAVPIGVLAAFASRERRAAVAFGNAMLDVRATSEEALQGFDVVFFASGEDASERYAPALVARGSVVIDNSATFRMRDGVPLIVPEINADVVSSEHRLFPVANCTAIVLCAALAPVRDVAGLATVRVATYQASSGAGRAGLDEFLAGEAAVASGGAEPEALIFGRPLARNVIPQIGSFDAVGYSGEENKVREETRKMLGLPELRVSATTVRVPVRTAHSEAVWFETQRATSVAELEAAFERAPGIVFHRDGIVTPREVEGTDRVHVARLRDEDPSDADAGRRFVLWCVGDQLRKGAATNAVQILELLLAKGYV
ncbi:MAG TPA: aspartate-semialdehyde dehydrogenase [Candidatus Baltobacteraceae bacterium]|nr:aspartate-semialdehyde dehydrogenase [Candidatus Baltobacteraceae bacterium]